MLDDKALSRGFMVANNGLQIHGENTNDVVSAEALMMLKEHIVEAYGPIRYTIGQGCSGGSYQQMDAAMYPGLLDGIQPNCSFTDLWTTATDVFDCGLLVHYSRGRRPAARRSGLGAGDRRPQGPERLRGLGRAVLQHTATRRTRDQLQAARRRGLQPGHQPRRRALHDRRTT